MEGSDKVVNNGGSRWNPTKEQINMLEGLYKQGLRTPSAEQIQQISARLRDFGHIEGKNVFYWFQNHKARQRQKQKQDNNNNNFACYNRFIHATPLFQPYQNVVCGPCYNMPQPKNMCPKVALPMAAAVAAGVDYKRSRLLIPADQTINDEPMYSKSMHEYPSSHHNHHHQETLDLFPIHPTGLLNAKNGNVENKNTSTSSENDNDCFIFGGEKAGKVHHFFDFFCKN